LSGRFRGGYFLADGEEGFVCCLARARAIRKLIRDAPQVFGRTEALPDRPGFLTQDESGAAKIVDGAGESAKPCAQARQQRLV
jgi:hypothetical protein